MPICGGANPTTANKLIKTNWWFFHGEKDDVVNPQHSRDMAMAMAMLNEGGNEKLTIYQSANHNSSDSTSQKTILFNGFFKKQIRKIST
ncbi:MAG: prolyl oligopeptidase family serine peptidase [Ferruginibacter sp.]